MFGRVGHSVRGGGGGLSRAQVMTLSQQVARETLQSPLFDEQVEDVLETATFQGATYVPDEEPTGATVGDVSLITAGGTTTTNPDTVGLSGEKGTTTVLADSKYVYVTAHVHDTVIVTPVAPSGFEQWLGAPFNTWHTAAASSFSVAEQAGEYHTTWKRARAPADVRLTLTATGSTDTNAGTAGGTDTGGTTAGSTGTADQSIQGSETEAENTTGDTTVVSGDSPLG